MIRLEHANISVVNTEEMTRFIIIAFPDFWVRGEGLDSHGRPWRHVGNDNYYIAIQTVSSKLKRKLYGNNTGLNHLGWEVDDVEALEKRMRRAGFEPNLKIYDHPARKRLYFSDQEGNDWEFVEYTTSDINERNDYS